jgi:PAS domain S-box-containing protein
MPKANLLCIDDEETGLLVRKLLLEREGFVVLIASSGKQGLEIFHRRLVNAVILDYSMPEMNGAAVAAEMKRQNPWIPIVLLTAHSIVPEDVQPYIDKFVEKGQSPRFLLEAIATSLRMPVHAHPELEGKYVVFVDSSRRYLEVTDGVCELLGYSRAELLRMTIDEVSAPGLRKSVPKLFRRYVQDGHMEGEFVLRRRDGCPVTVHYVSSVLADGCMAARWDPAA